MNMRLSLLALIACFGLSVSAHASDVDFNITGGTFGTSGTFSGSFFIDSATEMLDGGSITAIVPGSGTYNFTGNAGDPHTPGLEVFTDSLGDTFTLALNGPISALAINVDPYPTTLVLASGATYDAAGATLTDPPSAAPEPSSLLLLGTGALALAGSFRRRLLTA